MTQPRASTYKGVIRSRPALSRSIPRAAAVTPTRDFTQDFQDDDLMGVPTTCNPSEACISSYQGTIGIPPADPNLPRSFYGDVQEGDPLLTLSVTLVLTPNDTNVYHITGLTLFPRALITSTVPLDQLSPGVDWADGIEFQIFDPAGQVLYDSGACEFTSYWDQVLQEWVFTSCLSFSQLDAPGAKTLTLTRSFAINSVEILELEAVISSVTVQTTCGTISVQPLCQNDPTWSGKQYANNPAMTIGWYGCALTSLAMALNTYGASVSASTGFTPLQLNNLATAGHWYSGNSVVFDVFTRNVVASWKFHFLGPVSSLQSLVDPICQGHPVIVGVNLDSKGRPGHYVLVTGIDPTDPSTFLIADPACGSGKTTLKDYGNVFVPRGYVADPPNDISGLDIAITNCYVLVTSPTGQRTGIDPATGMEFNEIPQAGHFTDGLVNDVTGVRLPDTSSTVQVFQPSAGAYRVQLTSLLPQTSAISLFAFSTDGTAQPAHSFSVAAPPGHIVSFNAHYSSAPGSSLVFQPNTPTALTYAGATSCDYHDAAALVASLADTSVAPPVPVPDAIVTFTVGNQTCQAQTDGTGHATCALTLNQPPGAYTVGVHFGGNEVYLPSDAGPAAFTVTPEETTLQSVSSNTLPVGSVNIRGTLTEDQAAVPSPGGQTVDFTATPTTGGTPVTASATIDSAGVAQANLPLPPGAYAVTLDFGGDTYYRPSSASQTLYVYQPTQFVIWGGNPPIPFGQRANLVTGDSYEFWGADWSKQVLGGSFTGGASFKGYADQVDWTNGQWTTRPGGSSKPPPTLATYIGVIVATDIAGHGGDIQGNIAEVAVLDVTDPAAYRPDPGHRASGVLVAIAH